MEYLDELSHWIKNKAGKTNKPDINAALFLAQKDKIAAALGAGYTMKTVWEHLHEKKEIPFNYATFRKYVTQFIPDKKPVNAKEKMQAENSKEKPKDVNLSKPKTGFTFNPVPNKADLI